MIMVGMCVALAATAHAKAPHGCFDAGEHGAKAKVVSADTANPRQLGIDKLRAGDRDGALAAFESAAERTPNDAFVWRLVGDLRFDRNQTNAALEAWRTALELRPDDEEVVQRVAIAAERVGDFAAAMDAEAMLVERLRAALRSEPDGRRHDVGLGRKVSIADNYLRHLVILSELGTLAGDFSTAEDAARRAIEIAPKNVVGRLALGYMHLHAAEYDEAEDLYLEVLTVESNNTTARINLGNVYYMHRELDAAAKQFEHVLEIEGVKSHSESIALSNLAELFMLGGDYAEARDLYEAAIEVKPSGAWGYMGIAALFDVVGRYDEAIDHMIDGWERDQSKLSRLNTNFFQDEWYWQRDALIAEIEGESDLARRLWKQILDGDVRVLYKAAAHHLDAMDAVEKL